MRRLSLLLLLVVAPVTAQPRYGLAADASLTAAAGAETVLAVHRVSVALEDRVLPGRLFREHTAGRKALGIGYRAARLVLLSHPLDHTALLLQHEVFGHGARYREFGTWSQAGYRIALPAPYGDGSGFAAFRISEGGRTRDETIAATLNGSSASGVLAERLRRNALARGALHHREAMLYLHAGGDLLNYVLGTEETLELGSNDVLNWLSTVNQRAALDDIDARLTLGAVQEQALLGFLDPMLYLSAFVVLKTYLYDGDTALGLPLIPIGSVGYLPALRFGWGPFGTETTFDNVVAFDGRVVRFSVRRTEPTLYRAWGAGLDATRVVERGPVSLGARLDVWNQPPLHLDPSTPPSTGPPRVAGAGGSVTAFYGLPLGLLGSELMLELGYKTAGFVSGDRLGAGVIARFGLSLTE